MARTGPESDDVISLNVLWRGVDDQPILFANQFVIQHQQDEIILTVGQIQPPILLGDVAERMEQAKRLSFVPVNTVARFALNRQRLNELIGILQEQATKYDNDHREQNP